jgi:adenine-specific DNA-methyltransferase
MANYQKLQNVLTELFQLDKAELDFGIYRIMNQKRDDVLAFLSNKLPKEVRAILEGQQKGDATQLKKDLEDAIKTAKEFGVDPETNKKVLEAKAAYEAAGSIEGLEQEVFSHLASFFKRYYEGGDFVSLRRYKKDVYAIPYEGEEVKLHWANQDQYYIKTSENLKNYAFKLDGRKTVRFTLKEANTEQNNNKTQKDQERRFALYTEEPVTIEGDTIHINFTYEPHKKTVKQDKLLQAAIEQLTGNIPADFNQLFTLAPTEKNKKRTLLEKHLVDFSARNTFDYFIHKDLGGFLTRELDFYIKNEVLFIDDINTDNEQAFATQLSKIRALKQVASKIITFLAQLENFQKKLWLKKKFVISCDYCITLDRIPESYYPEIHGNTAQLKEWKTLFNVEIKNLDELKEESYLVLDTKFFSQEFKDKLLAEFDDLDEQTNGLMINSDNFQALSFIQNSKKNKVEALYIDPPYNTNASEILYKNGYKSSSWLGLMENRLKMSYPILNEKSITCATIDDLELRHLNSLLHQIYGEDNHQATVLIRNNPSGRATVKGFAINHEYGLFYSKDSDLVTLGRLPHSEKQTNRYEEKDEAGNYFEWENFRKNGTDSDRANRPKQYFPFYYDVKTNKLRLPKMEFLDNTKKWNILEQLSENEIQINPIDENGFEKVWKFGEERTRESTEDFLVKENGEEYRVYRKKYLNNEGSLPRTWWEDPKFSARDRGTRDIRNLFGKSTAFDFPKSVYAVSDSIRISLPKNEGYILDYFAGSGTTGHATLKLNREDQGNRKYILVEMGEYFNTVTKPRIQKIIYTDNWKNGKPQDKEGISQMFKYFNLETYEDALNNLQLRQNQDQQQLLDTNADMQEEYLLQYMLDVETREHLMNIEAFKNPFNYKLNITENNELVPTTIDLVETFNYLIGLNVKRIQRIGAFKTVEGVTNDGDKVLVIWRNLEESNNDDLNAFVNKMDYNLRDGEFDTIYVNGDNNLANLKQDTDTWKVGLLEEVFFILMFDNKDI